MTVPAPSAAAADAARSRRLAVLAMVGASALIAVTSLIAKALGLGEGEAALHPFQVSAGRFLFGLTTLCIFALWLKPDFRGAAWPVHVGRTLAGWVGATCLFAAAARMPLADATAISFLSPVVTMALAILFLGERVGPWRWLAVAVALAGALILIRPGTAAYQPAAILALGAAGFMGMEAVLIKRLSDSEPPIRILLINNALGAAIACTAAAFVWLPPGPSQWPLLVLIGVAMVGAQSLFIQAMKRGQASHVIPAFYCTLVFATLYDFALFGDLPDALAFLGAALIVAGVVLLLLRQQARR